MKVKKKRKNVVGDRKRVAELIKEKMKLQIVLGQRDIKPANAS